jgi:hypothetical protein
MDDRKRDRVLEENSAPHQTGFGKAPSNIGKASQLSTAANLPPPPQPCANPKQNIVEPAAEERPDDLSIPEFLRREPMNRLLEPPPAIVETVVRYECPRCGNNCECGVPYVAKTVRATEAIKANPEKSDRMIAKEIDASPTTVGKAREQLSTTGQLKDTPRIGLDGKTRKTTSEPLSEGNITFEPVSEDKIITTAANGPVFEITKILRRLSPSGRVQLRRIALEAWSDANMKEDTTYF